MRRYILHIILLCNVLVVFGQEHDPSTVLARLLQARGEVRNDYPTVRIIDRVKNIAAYVPTTNEIIIERKAINECLKLGNEAEAALAFIISHELTHFFQHKVWSSQEDNVAFFSSSSDFEQLKPFEEQADTYGAFLCYLAKYNYAQVAPKIIEKLYTSYQLNPDNLIVYPDPEKRKELALSVCEQVDQFVLYFEAAKALSHFGQYHHSQALLTSLLQFLDFKELYNNAGVNQFKMVLSHRPEILNYPMVVKPALALRTGLSLSLDSLLFKAHENFVTAVVKDPGDHDLFINLASVKLQMGWIDQYNELVDQLKNVNLTTANRQRLDILQAIHLANQNRISEAIRLLRLIKSSATDELISQTCEQNILKLRGKGKRSYLQKSDGSSFVPKVLTGEPYSSEIIDKSDPLLPIRCKLRKDKNVIQMELEQGKEKITLWYIPQEQQNYTNTYVGQGKGYAWYIQ